MKLKVIFEVWYIGMFYIYFGFSVWVLKKIRNIIFMYVLVLILLKFFYLGLICMILF